MTVIEAVWSGDREQVRALLEAGSDPNEIGLQGCTALTYAAKSNSLEIVEALLQAGADPNHRDDDTETVLMWAADHSGNAAVLHTLLQAGADVNAQSNTVGTALTWTMRHGDPEMVQALLDSGANIRPYDLSLAVQNGFAPAVRLLLEHGADPNDPTDLATASNRGHREVANLLRQAMADRRLQATGESYPPRRYPIGTYVRILTGTPREGWIVLIEWHFKHGKYGYYIEVQGKTQLCKTESKRYWEEDLQPITEDL